MKVAIITEGFQGTGYGHLTRCLSIYQGFEEIGITPNYIANYDDNGKLFLPNVNLIQLNWLQDINELIGMIKGYDIAIIDSYLAPKKIYEEICKNVIKAVYIDDYIRLDYPPGIIINGTIGAEKLQYKKDREHEYLLGVEYMLLRKEFWDVKKVDRKKREIKNILIIFGAQDIKNLTDKVLNSLLNKFPEFNYFVIENRDNRKTVSNVFYYNNLTAKEMLELMLKCDLAISAAGQTSYELARLGIPSILIGVAENQRYNLKGWKEAGFINEELWGNDFCYNLHNIDFIMKAKVKIGKYLDGQGVRRIVKYVTR